MIYARRREQAPQELCCSAQKFFFHLRQNWTSINQTSFPVHVYTIRGPIRIHPESTWFAEGFPACNAQKNEARGYKAFFRLTGPLSFFTLIKLFFVIFHIKKRKIG